MRLTFLIVLLTVTSISGQTLQPFSIVRVDSTFAGAAAERHGVVFGGLSALELTSSDELWAVSDRQKPSASPEHQYSWLYRMDTLGNFLAAEPFMGIKNVEALRIEDQKLWFSFENDETTGIGLIDENGQQSILAEHSLITSPYTTLNRGIEGLALNEDLWYSFEAGLDSTVFIRWPERNADAAEVYRYPLNRESCLRPSQSAGSSLGTGVSEILHIPGHRDRLLVLERCFNGRGTFISLFEAIVQNKTFVKREIFSWNPESQFHSRTLRPDNMEGMTWGKNEGERRTLYLISDDNHNPKYQRTLLVKLIEMH